MACFEYKLTMEYRGALAWNVSVYERQVLIANERSEWRCILYKDVPTLEGHVDPTDRLKMVLRSLG